MNFRGINFAAVLALGILLSACGGGSPDSASTTPVTSPAAKKSPHADAGRVKYVAVGDTVTLDGSASFGVTVDGSASFDLNGDTLTYQWTLTSVPRGSTAVLSSATAQKPTFVADVSGTYTASLVVNDGEVTSGYPSTVSIHVSPATSYTKLDAAGLPLPDSATSWSCVRDNTKNLVWEVKNMTDPAHLRYYRNGYTNYDSTDSAQYRIGPFIYANPTQAQIDAPSNSIGFKNAVNAQGLCGVKDWRLPDFDELEGLLTGSSVPYINTSYFPDVDQSHTCQYACYGYFWSSSPGRSDGRLVYFDGYGIGYLTGSDPRGYSGAVRLVSGEGKASSSNDTVFKVDPVITPGIMDPSVFTTPSILTVSRKK